MDERQILSPTITGFRASISAITISRTSSRRSICAARPTAKLLRPQRLPFRGHDRERRQSHVAGRRRAGLRLSIASSTFPPTAPTGSAAKLTVDINVASIDQTNAAFQSTGLQTFDNAYHLYNVCETQVGDTFVNTYFPGKCMLRGIAGDYTRATGQVSWQRSYIDPDRRGVEAIPVRSPRRRGDRTQRNRIDHLRERDRREHRRQFEPGRFLLGLEPGRFRARHGGRRARIPFPFISTSSWGTQTITPIAPVHRPAERGHPQDPAERGFPEPRFRRNEPVRLEQVLRIRPGRRGHAAQLRVPVHRRISPTAATPISSAGNRSRSPGRIPTPSMIAANVGLRIPASIRRCPTSSSARRCSRPRTRSTFISKQQFDSSTLQLDRFDGIAKANIAGVSGSVDYALYAAQPALGWEYPREGLTGNLGLQVPRSLVGRRLAGPRHVAPLLRRVGPGRRRSSIRSAIRSGSATRTNARRSPSGIRPMSARPAVYSEYPGGPSSTTRPPATRL